MMSAKSIQQQYTAEGICYGCGPKNRSGLQLNSFPSGSDKVIAEWEPQAIHQAFDNIVNGGVIGTLLDCHCNMAAAWFYMQQENLNTFPTTVTAEYTIKLLKPTPLEALHLVATLDRIEGRKIYMQGTLGTASDVTALCSGLFIAKQT